MKRCNTCIYFPCTKVQCNLAGQEGCGEYKSVSRAEMEKVDNKAGVDRWG